MSAGTKGHARLGEGAARAPGAGHARRLLGFAFLLGALLGGGTLEAQFRGGVETGRMMREAAALEARGDLEGAEAVLRRVLEEDPASTGALFSLERVVRARGAPAGILPMVDTFLDRDPGSAPVWALKLRVLVEVDSLEALRREASRWIEVAPTEATYREVATAYEAAFGVREALDLLTAGRELLGGTDVLALELGDLRARTGDVDGAVREWTVAVGDDGTQAAPVARRLRELPEGGDRAARTVLEALADAPVFARRRAGALIALELRMEGEALEAARAVAEELGGRARTAFLEEVGERAGTLGVAVVAAWAYDALGEDARTPAERRAFDQRMIEVALASGDTAAATGAQSRIAASFPTGSPDRMQALVQVLRLGARSLDASTLASTFDAFVTEFPGVPEIDELAATVSRRLRADGDVAGALAVLERAGGPRSAVERGYLLLAEGRVAEGREVFLGAVQGLPPSEATETIRLIGLLGRLSPGGGAALGRASALAHHGRAGEAVDLLEEGALAAAEERPLLLAHAARMAEDAGDRERAADLRSRLLSEHPGDPSVPEAALALARYHASLGGEGTARAIAILEDLIASMPDAAVAPSARAELARLRSAG